MADMEHSCANGRAYLRPLIGAPQKAGPSARFRLGRDEAFVLEVEQDRRGFFKRSALFAVELMPVEREAIRGAVMLDELARTYARLDNADAALDTLERIFALRN